MPLARAARSRKPGQGAVAVTSRTVLSKPAAIRALLHRLGELEIEHVFGNAACTDGARHCERVADVEHDAERRPPAA